MEGALAGLGLLNGQRCCLQSRIVGALRHGREVHGAHTLFGVTVFAVVYHANDLEFVLELQIGSKVCADDLLASKVFIDETLVDHDDVRTGRCVMVSDTAAQQQACPYSVEEVRAYGGVTSSVVAHRWILPREGY